MQVYLPHRINSALTHQASCLLLTFYFNNPIVAWGMKYCSLNDLSTGYYFNVIAISSGSQNTVFKGNWFRFQQQQIGTFSFANNKSAAFFRSAGQIIMLELSKLFRQMNIDSDLHGLLIDINQNDYINEDIIQCLNKCSELLSVDYYVHLKVDLPV